MVVFRYDLSFEGLLTAVFDAYVRRTFPDVLASPGEPGPLFADEVHEVVPSAESAGRVWHGLERRLSKKHCNMLLHAWLSEVPGTDALLLRYMRAVFDGGASAACDFSDPAVIEVRRRARIASHEAHYLVEFTRLRRAADGEWFAAVAPKCNALPLTMHYFPERFADQQWIIYDVKRHYGYRYDTHEVTEMTLPDEERFLAALTDDSLLHEREREFRTLWKGYFESVSVGERFNPRLQRRCMPARFWPYLTEME